MSEYTATMFFTMSIAVAMFWLSFKEQPFVTGTMFKEWANLILKRGCLVVALFLMSFNSAIMSTLVSAAGLNLTREMFMFMRFFGWAGYIAAVFMGFMCIVDGMKMWQDKKHKTRMGEDE